MTKFQKQFVEKFTDRFIDWNSQKEIGLDAIVSMWVSYIHDQWHLGQITLKEYQSLLRVDIFNA